MICHRNYAILILLLPTWLSSTYGINPQLQVWLADTIELATDTPEGQPRVALADFARVSWVRHDRQRSRITPLDQSWLDWQKRTGEMPPDFDKLPSSPFLPDPLLLRHKNKSIQITTVEQWRVKRKWIREQFAYWIAGSAPPAPNNVKIKILKEVQEGSTTVRDVELRFGPDLQAKMTVTLFIPQGRGPFPVFMTQWNTDRVKRAVQRGYLGCLYRGAKGRDDTENYHAIWPEADWGWIRRRAWGGSRVLDYLVTVPEVDPNRIGVFGHSRQGKQALYLAATDERVSAVIAGSCFVAGINAIRYNDRDDTQSLDENSYAFPYWFHPRLRYFVGREHKLPIDMHEVLALVAPRPMLIHASKREPDAQPWGVEKTVASARQVYRFLGAEDKLVLHHRDGSHRIPKDAVELYCDFFDGAFGRKAPMSSTPELYSFSHEKWRKRQKPSLDPGSFPQSVQPNIKNAPQDKNDIQDRLRWLLGKEPQETEPIHVRLLPQRPLDPNPDIYQAKSTPRILPFDEARWHPQFQIKIRQGASSLRANAYLPRDWNQLKALPAAVFLHGYTYGTGYHIRAGALLERFAERGVVAITFDQLGFGLRIEEGTSFYHRFPEWSKLGAMVRDVSSVISALKPLGFVDADQVFLVGHDVGGLVGLVTAALDKRVKGVAASCAIFSWRTVNPEIEGLRGLAIERGLLPRLGLFLGQEERIPTEMDEICSLIAPRPLLLVAPKLDRHTDRSAVDKIADRIAATYRSLDQKHAFILDAPRNFHRFTKREKDLMIQWVLDHSP